MRQRCIHAAFLSPDPTNSSLPVTPPILPTCVPASSPLVLRVHENLSQNTHFFVPFLQFCCEGVSLCAENGCLQCEYECVCTPNTQTQTQP